MSENDDFVREWALHDAMRKKIFREAWESWKQHLKNVGHTEESLKDVEEKAIAIMGGQEQDTEYGKVIVESNTAYLHKNSQAIGTRSKLKLITKG